MSAAGPKTRASIVVPTFREGPNLEPLIERTFAATSSAGIGAEMIIVDDNSQDETEEVVGALASRHPVRLIVRRDERGLSSAVLAGFREARFDVLVVMDADLQHPPELVPVLIDRLAQPGCDFATGTRYAAGAEIAENWPWLRRLNSRLAILLARPLTPLSDPMSGFFALRRETWMAADRLDPIGYKIGLELYVKGRCRRPAEVPIRFGVRAHGTSKTSIAERIRYLRHLRRLYVYRFAWGSRVAGSLLIAVVGLALWAFVNAVWFG
jgi:dolichol-phosphate mannosyltransferase